MRHRLGSAVVVMAMIAAGCSGNAEADPDLEIDRVTGYVVIVEERSDGMSIGFAEDRDAVAGVEYDVTEAVWRVEGGAWIEPPVACVGKGQRVELGITAVEEETRPGLLKDRVVWLACLTPDDA